MRPQKIQDEELLLAITKVFRSKGYEGASLSELSEVTGLKKASLYHRFPKGKQEMAESVMAFLDKWVTENIFNALNKEEDAPQIRLKNGVFQIKKLYSGGKETCIFRAFSMQTGMDLFHASISNGLNDWLRAFKNLGVSMGLSNELSAEKAMQTLIDIQGSLILSKGLQDPTVFENTMERIEKRYI